LTGLQVTRVQPASAFERKFGIKVNDTIVGFEQRGAKQRIRDLGNDPEMAKAMVIETYQFSGTLTVLRDGKEIILPQPAPAGAGEQTDSVDRQMESLRKLTR
jgi:hypothetical protein